MRPFAVLGPSKSLFRVAPSPAETPARLAEPALFTTGSVGPGAIEWLGQVLERRSLASIWRALCDGALAIHGIRNEGAHTIAVFRERTPQVAAAHAVVGRDLVMLQRVLEGASLKVLAEELGASLSSVSSSLSRTTKRLGLSGGVAVIPILLAELACAEKERSTLTAPWYRVAPRLVAIVVPRVEPELSKRLSPAEVEVCGLALAGLSYAQMSARRRTSKRTIANQLSSAFRRLEVSGRSELMARVASLLVSPAQPTAWQSTTR